ncbi:MAG TPA: polysaccharide deacetylase family protein [Gaiellaceae bacterium]|nr:polysaccharide deacetylase family protein [Gaiellaceae bacterium]
MSPRSEAVALGILGAAAWAAPAPAPVVPAFARTFKIPLRLEGSNGVAITFDDGPHPQGTPAVLEALAAARATATFFLVGEQVERYPAVAAEIAAAGHEIALHGYRHTLLLRRSPRGLADDLDRAAAAIQDATGHAPSAYRPPYGVFSSHALRLVRLRGWAPLLWSHWGHDWGANDLPTQIVERATTGLEPGDVVLLHDADHYSAPGSWRQTAAALPSILDAVAAIGAPCVAVTQST